MNNNRLSQIYTRIKQQHQNNGWEINEQRLKQQAWHINNRLLFESTSTNPAAAAAAAAAGAGGAGGGGRKADVTSLLTEEGLTLQSEAGENLSIE